MGKPFTPERLENIRRMRRARRLFRKQPLFAYDAMRKEYPAYTYDQFWDDLRYRRKPKRRKGRNPLVRYGRWGRMESLKARYGNTGNVEYALQALRLRRHMAKPYRVLAKVGGEILEYGLSPFIPISEIEKLVAELPKCKSESEADVLVERLATTIRTR